MENKQKICELLLAALQATRGAHDLVSLEYERINEDREYVIGTFASGGRKRCNVSMDSGCAMIRDIMNQLGV